MALKWYLKKDQGEVGPKGFAELVELVRSQSLTESDLVRSEWQDEWQRADSIVGLFYMARQTPVEAISNEPLPDAEHLSVESSAEQLSEAELAEQHPVWMKRLLYLMRLERPLTPEEAAFVEQAQRGVSPKGLIASDSVDDAPSIGSTPSHLASAIDAATGSLGSYRENNSGAIPLAQSTSADGRKSRSALTTVARVAFRLVLVVVCAAMALRTVHGWSTDEVELIARRTYVIQRQLGLGIRNGRSSELVQQLRQNPPSYPRYFPLVGNCTDFEYLCLMETLAVVVAIVAYQTAKVIDISVMKPGEPSRKALA